MAKKKEVYKVKPLNENKKNIIAALIDEYDDVPQDRSGTFEPKIVKKRQKDISGIDQKIISMYARGLTTRQISDQIEEIYGFECEGFISDVTDKILQDIEDWQKKPLESVYPSDKALLKTLYLSTLQATKKWGQALRGWGKVYGEFSIMYPDRMPDRY